MRFVSCCALLMLPFVTASGQVRAAPVIVGRVLNAQGTAIAGASVESGGALQGVSDSTGVFRIAGVVPGPMILRVRRLGYLPADVDVVVPPAGPVAVDVRLAATALHLAPVEVRDRADPSEARLAGFRDRLERRSGGGHFITRAQLDRRANTRLIEIIRELPGVRMRGPTRFADRSIRLRGANCPPLVFIDGFPALTAEFELDIVDLSTVEGIEVYPGLASVPAPFQAPRAQHRCGVIAVWSRPAAVRPVARRAEQPARVATLVDAGQVFRAGDVDRVAELLVDESPEPVYPDSLWKAGVGGEAVIEVIVDTLGRVEPQSVSIVTESTALFGRAARDAVRSSVFMPALRGTKRVRQVVHVPVVFRPATGRSPGADGPGWRM